MKFISIFIFILFAVNLNSQSVCGAIPGVFTECFAYGDVNMYAHNGITSIPLLRTFNGQSQGPYTIQMNGKIFNNHYLFSGNTLCCHEISASDLGYDFAIPGTYDITLESISHDFDECIASTISPVTTRTITVHEHPSFDVKFTCLENGDVQVDVILTSQINFLTGIFLTGLDFQLIRLGEYDSPGDIIYSGIKNYSPNEEVDIRIRDCNTSSLFLELKYIHNCSNCSDVTPPVALCKDLTLGLGLQDAIISIDDINDNSVDDCGVVALSLDKTRFDCSNIGQNTVVLQVADAGGNSSSCTSIVTLQDNGSICSTCYNFNTSPVIEFSHTELIGNDVKIWFRVLNVNQYQQIANRISGPAMNHYYYDEYFEDERFYFSNKGESDVLGNFVFIQVEFDDIGVPCATFETELSFSDGVCNVLYRSNSVMLNCDNDNDGFDINEDCNDNNALQYPGAIEICDGVDNNCNGQIDEGFNDVFGNCCPFELNVNQSGIIAGTYKADYRINSRGQVNGQNVELKAGSEVNMENGFEVTLGSVLHAHIAPCN